MDARMIEATGQVAEDFYIVSHWAVTSELPQSQQFVKDFEAEYGRIPTEYAMVGYDTALWIDSAIKKVDGDISDKDALHAALKTHDFESLRGQFSLANNQHPILDYYLLQLKKDENGELRPQVVRKVIEQGTDNFAVECEM
jgi:branched-chain amino acid transport system substrate-binding protein